MISNKGEHAFAYEGKKEKRKEKKSPVSFILFNMFKPEIV